MSYALLNRLYYQNKTEYEKLYDQRFNAETTQRFNFEIHGNTAFYCMCPEIYNLTSEIMRTDKRVFELCCDLPQVALRQFTDKCLIDEIVLTNDIEGVYSSRKEINNVLHDLRANNKRNRFYGLVNKYRMLNRDTISFISCNDIRKIYDELVLSEIEEDDPRNCPDGILFRKDMAEVANTAQKVIHHGVYPETNIIECMEKALAILNNENYPILIRIAVFHYLFGYIHPFYDGNGRTSRFISSYLLSENFEHLIGYRLSYTIKEKIKEYYNCFKICNDSKNKGDLTPFIIMFLNIIYESFKNLENALEKRWLSLEHYQEKIMQLSGFSDEFKNGICYVLLQARLYSDKGICKKELCDVFKISPSTLDKRLSELHSAGFLDKITFGRQIFYSFNINNLPE